MRLGFLTTPYLLLTIAMTSTSCSLSSWLDLTRNTNSPSGGSTTVDIISLSSFSFSSVTDNGMTAIVSFSGDENLNAVLNISWCNVTDNAACTPTNTTAMTRSAGHFTITLSGLSSPNDPGDNLKFSVTAIDLDGTSNSPLISTQELTKTISIGNSTSKGYTVADTTVTDPINTQTLSNFIVFVTQEANTGPGTVTDNSGNTYSQIGSYTDTNGGIYPDQTYVFHALGATGRNGHTFTYSKVNGYSSVFVVELNCLSPILNSQQQITVGTTASPYDSGNMTTTANSSVLVAFGTPGEVVANPTFTWNNGFTNQTEIANFSSWMGSIGTRLVTPGIYSGNMSSTEDAGGGIILLEYK